MAPERAPQVTQLLAAAQGGDATALERLTPLVYGELRARAAALLRAESTATVEPTALADETFVYLVRQERARWSDRGQFFAVASTCIRRLLVDRARRRRVRRRGAAGPRVELDGVALAADAPSLDVLALHEALDRLAAIDGRKARVVELRYFGGLRNDEVAAALAVGVATVERDLRFARAWLQRELGAAEEGA